MNKNEQRMMSLYRRIHRLDDYRVHDGKVYLMMSQEDLMNRIGSQPWSMGTKMNRILSHALAQRIAENAKPIEGSEK